MFLILTSGFGAPVTDLFELADWLQLLSGRVRKYHS